ncbi:DUF2075 domain-containing protein [Mucilaginibacter boryungensis]|uniref:DUF2075 domain-containing protein n=1 Tax=Mucilaginibacter boryungensis TaxID=768480 RepID=A0ABR9XKP2_9SPHI|nr:DUF2075 domain-containing protein [Mucilaginibacter boryungensis]MBE9667949.1 DUF2075 domain-containing protein [Mucilaginibacter boryungensis]
MGAYYSNSISGFLKDDTLKISGSLSHEAGLAGFHQQLHTQTLSWNDEIIILKSAFQKIVKYSRSANNWGILLEYPIARREKRIDVVIIANDIIIVLEFKVGKIEYLNSDKDQVLDYCLDLRDFHSESRDKIIVPILLATEGKSVENKFIKNLDFVQEVIIANSINISEIIVQIVNAWGNLNLTLKYEAWNESDYSPTPTIIEAAQNLYAGKSVVEISRSHAGKKNLTKTSNAVVDAIKTAKATNQKIICFITGVPGAGKTLAGLNIAHDKEFQDGEQSLATFLSGNGPLIKVLRNALSRDAHKRLLRNDTAAKKKETDRIISFIENVHRFLDHYFVDKDRIQNNKIVIFDEAQRAWNAEHSLRKFNRPYSESEMMLEIMNRHTDWAVIVALVGGGQEINTGEAGLPEWGKVIQQKFTNWKIYISPQLKTGNHSTGNLTLFENQPNNLNITENPDLHLDVSIRSYKAEELSRWVNLVLTNQPIEAKTVFNENLTKYKIVITRDLEKAKQWLRAKCKGTRRMGLVASSGARRLRPHGLDVRLELEEAEWFLNTRDDVRSSYYLEIPATEFGIQGLELDWVGACWDLDLRRNGQDWDFNAFKGTKWQKVSKVETRQFILNKYRVLLTRAREGMVIFVPVGDINDHTRPPEYYNNIASYLMSCGVRELPAFQA